MVFLNCIVPMTGNRNMFLPRALKKEQNRYMFFCFIFWANFLAYYDEISIKIHKNSPNPNVTIND